MQPIILLGIMAVGAAALSTGFLAPEIENIWVQNIGVGEADLFQPVDHVAVDLDVQAIENFGPNGQDDAADCAPNCDDYFDNKVVECSWHIGTDDLATNDMGTQDESDDMTETDIEEVICKITDENGNAIAECGITYPQTVDDITGESLVDYPFSDHQKCGPEGDANPFLEAYEGALLIDNVEDVKIVVRGENPAIQGIPQDP